MKNLYISMYRGDGPGTIIQRILSTDAFCKKEGYNFKGVVSDIKQVYWHTELFYEKFNDFFGIRLKKRDNIVGLINGEKDFKNDKSNNILYDENFIQGIVEKDVDKYFNRKWREGILKNLEIEKKRKILSVHIRRGDVNKKEFPGRYLDDDIYIKIIDTILENDNCEVNLFSQRAFNGDLSKYIKRYRKKNKLKIFLDNTHKSSTDEGIEKLLNSIFTDWKKMINSDYLITSRSSFSYVPALLCRGEVWYAPFWHKKLKEWKIYDIT